MRLFKFGMLKGVVYPKVPGLHLLDFNPEIKTLDGFPSDLALLRENYIRSQDLPIWKRRMYTRKILISALIPMYLAIFCYRKIERIIDFLEYSI